MFEILKNTLNSSMPGLLMASVTF